MREERIREMLDAFVLVFSAEGLDGASMKKLSKGAQMTESLIYRYFDNKDDLIKQCTVRYHLIIQCDLMDIINAYYKKSGTLANKLQQYIKKTAPICRFLLQVMAHPTYSVFMQDTSAKITHQLLAFAVTLQEEYQLDEHTAMGISFGFNSIINDYILRQSPEIFKVQIDSLQKTYLAAKVK